MNHLKVQLAILARRSLIQEASNDFSSNFRQSGAPPMAEGNPSVCQIRRDRDLLHICKHRPQAAPTSKW
jgi:hypothetical protein